MGINLKFLQDHVEYVLNLVMVSTFKETGFNSCISYILFSLICEAVFLMSCLSKLL